MRNRETGTQRNSAVSRILPTEAPNLDLSKLGASVIFAAMINRILPFAALTAVAWAGWKISEAQAERARYQRLTNALARRGLRQQPVPDRWAHMVPKAVYLDSEIRNDLFEI
jgi:hypothetical protein